MDNKQLLERAAVGRLSTMNQDDYPGLGAWWVQIRIGAGRDEILARVYGSTPQEARTRAVAITDAITKAAAQSQENT